MCLHQVVPEFLASAERIERLMRKRFEAPEEVPFVPSVPQHTGLPLESRTPPVGRIAPARRSVFHVHNASLYP